MDDIVFQTLNLALEDGAVTLPADGPVLFLKAAPSPFLTQLPRDRLVCHQSFKPDHDALKAAGYNVLAPDEANLPSAQLTLLLPPRQKDEAKALYARAMLAMPEGGVLLCCVPNTLGSKTAEKTLRELTGNTEALSKHKCRAFWAIKTSDTFNTALAEEWLANDAPREVVPGELWSRPGLFSRDRVDAGSELLADSIPETIKGRGADFGAGQGYIARQVLLNCPKVESMTLYEAEHRALSCIEKTMDGVGEYTAHWTDIPKSPLNERFHFIAMNPPFHVGRADAASLGQDFIRAASRALKPAGQLYMVANRHLPYEEILSAVFKTHDMIEDAGGYKVIVAERPKRPK